mmetsp:Transcript_8044/g.15230  ORF Transcript_8044/g.15230 Transcript_8044/m.15230 type:complete len:83 (-) Transcript_8044:95-343(-)
MENLLGGTSFQLATPTMKKMLSRPPRCKTVKLMEEPSVEQLGAELLLLGMWLQSMVAHEEDFDVVMDDSEETMLRMHEQFSL